MSLWLATMSNSKLLLCKGPCNSPQCRCAENVVVWPPFKTQLNSFVSSDGMAIVPSIFLHRLCLCARIHTCLPFASTFGFAVRAPVIACGFLLALPLLDMSAVWFIFLTDWYLWGPLPLISPFSVSVRVSCRFDLRTGSSAFPCSLFVYIMFEAARISSRTVSFRGPLMTISMFAKFDRVLCIAFRISSRVSFPCCCSLKRRLMSLMFLLNMMGGPCLSIENKCRFSFWTVSCRYKPMKFSIP